MSSSSPSSSHCLDATQKCIEALMSIPDWSYADLLRYGKYKIESFISDNSNTKASGIHKNFRDTLHLKQLIELSQYVYTTSSTVDPDDDTMGTDALPQYLSCYMLKNDAVDFLNNLGETAARWGLYTARYVSTNRIVCEWIDKDALQIDGENTRVGMKLGNLPIENKAITQLSSAVHSHVQKLISDPENPLVFVQIFKRRHPCRTINESLLMYYTVFYKSPLKWSFAKLLEFAKWQLDRFDEKQDINITGLDPESGLTGVFMKQMKELNLYMFTTQSTERPEDPTYARMMLKGYLPLQSARKLCDFLLTKKLYYILRAEKDKEPIEVYGNIISREGNKYTTKWKNWLNEAHSEIPNCISSKIDDLIDDSENPLACVEIEHNHLTDRNLYEILLKYFRSESVTSE